MHAEGIGPVPRQQASRVQLALGRFEEKEMAIFCKHPDDDTESAEEEEEESQPTETPQTDVRV